MKTEVILDMPYEIAGRIATGDLERVGGVVRDKATGRVVMWLRETGPSPILPDKVSLVNAKDILKLSGSVASILNLGATVAFGAATLKKLSRIEGKVDIINAKIDELSQRIQKVQWTVELGFANTLQALDGIKQYQEIELAGELNSAAILAWSCQFLEPGGTQRIARMENAFHTASNIKEKLLIHAKQDISSATDKIANKRKTDFGFAFDKETITAIFRLRQTIAASSLCSSIIAEADGLYSAGNTLNKELSLLNDLHIGIGRAALGSDELVYRNLLSAEFMDLMPASRLDSWCRRYDNKVTNLFSAVDLFRKKVGESTSPLDTLLELRNMSSYEFEKSNKQIRNENTGLFIDQLDGISEDLSRLKGYELEYRAGSDLGLQIQEYRDMLRIDSTPENDGIVFLKSLPEAA